MSLIRTMVFLLLLVPGVGMTAELAPSTLVIQPQRIIILPVRDATYTETSLFLHETDPRPIAIRTLETRLEHGLKNTLADFHNAERISGKTLKSRVTKNPQFSGAIQAIEEHLHAGENAYKNMDLPKSLEELNMASTLGMQQDLDILQPELLGKIEFLKGLALLEQGKTARAHIAFKGAIQFEPHHGRIQGYFPTAVEEAMMVALQELKTRQTPELEHDPQRLANLLKRLHADQLLMPTILGTGIQKTLRLVVFDRHRKGIVFRATFPLGSPLKDQDQIERAISRWRTCTIVETEGDIPTRKSSRFHVDTNFTHGVFLAHPTRQPMQNLGLTLQAGWMALDNLEISGTFSSHFSLADSFGDQEGGMTSLRTSLGTAFVLRSGLWRIYLRPALEMHRIGRLRVITDAHCKFFGVEHPACPTGSVTDLDETILWGLHAGMGASMDLGKHLQINLGIGFSGYLVSEESELNHFFTSELGIGYQF